MIKVIETIHATARRSSLACLACAIGLLPALAIAAQDGDDAPGAALALQSIREIRQLDLVEAPANAMSMSEAPGVVLTYRLTLPDGVHFLEAEQPTEVVATDAAGTNLAEIPMHAFERRRIYVTPIQEWDKPVEKLEFRLALPARAAETFDLKVPLKLSTYRDTKSVTIAPGEEWTALDADIFGDTKVESRVRKGARGGVHVKLRPVSVRGAVERVEIVTDDEVTESMGTMWDRNEVSWHIPAELTDGATIRMTVRTGVEQRTVTIEEKARKLP